MVNPSHQIDWDVLEVPPLLRKGVCSPWHHHRVYYAVSQFDVNSMNALAHNELMFVLKGHMGIPMDEEEPKK